MTECFLSALLRDLAMNEERPVNQESELPEV